MAEVEAKGPLLVRFDEMNGVQDWQESLYQEGGDGVDEILSWIDPFLSFLGFKQRSSWQVVWCWTLFLLIGVVVPVVILMMTQCGGDCEQYQINSFELDIVASQACLAAVSLICISYNLRKFGTRGFLFVDRESGRIGKFEAESIQKIKRSVRLLALWMFPLFFFKLGREILRLVNVQHESWWVSLSVLLGLVGSSTYTSIVYLSSCLIFHLVCDLQIIHFDDYVRLLETEGNVLVLIEEHTRLRYYLSKISHRFRIFLVLEIVVVSASQIVTLFQTTGSSGTITIINGGDFAISSFVQVVGVILCLHGATKISHIAQNTASVATRWHSLVTCSLPEGDGSSPLRVSVDNTGNYEAANNRQMNSFMTDYESDVESLDFAGLPSNSQLPSHISSYHRRQSFVLYLQHNPGGITLYGWTVDRGLITTIFLIELSLITFVLGQTIVFA